MMLLLSLCYFQLSVTWFLTFHERIIAMQLTFRLQNGTTHKMGLERMGGCELLKMMSNCNTVMGVNN